jgi:thioredoxin-dependent peroxiredoxin
MTKLEVGKKAPAFTLPDQDGQTVSLSDFAGKRVILYFYPKDDTPGCTKEACQFNDLLTDFAKHDAEVLGVSADSADSHRKFQAKYSLNLRLLTDADRKVMNAYGAFGEKNNYGKKTMGVIRSTFVIGPTGVIEKAMYNVKADGHADKILAGIAE